ncbi:MULTISPECIES: AAA family ATPase [Polaromonas]|uniref:AAA family ATPase n=1 Tax=Polaromonas aquatica TaxID=332657 RepID=A0ABW1U1P0_9BURK
MPANNEMSRPELLLGPNPLIEAIPPFVPFKDLMRHLRHYPLDHAPDWRQVPPDYREALLECATQHFAPYQPILELAAGIQLLLRRALSMGNPLRAEVRKRANQVGVANSVHDFRHVTHVDGGGGMVDGITGLGKTNAVQRALAVFAPNQVIEHLSCPQAGWARMMQCVYLYIDFPSNGTRGALLKRILMGLDEQLGTNYSEQNARKTNLDALLVVASKLLVLHRVALLVIDEKQDASFNQNPLQYEFVLFYLSLMNLGISVLLIGNPLAFTHLQTFSQVMRRFSVGGMTSLEPASHQDEKWWCEGFVPRMRKFCVVEGCAVDEQLRARLEFEASAGTPGLFQRYFVETQRAALRRAALQRGTDSAEMTVEDFVAARKSERYKELQRIATSIRSGSEEYDDIPQRQKAFGPSMQKGEIPESPAGTGQPPPAKPMRDVVGGLLRNYKAAQTREANLLAKRIAAMQSYSDDDLRMLGVSHDLVEEAQKIGDTVPAAKKRKKGGAV